MGSPDPHKAGAGTRLWGQKHWGVTGGRQESSRFWGDVVRWWILWQGGGEGLRAHPEVKEALDDLDAATLGGHVEARVALEATAVHRHKLLHDAHTLRVVADDGGVERRSREHDEGLSRDAAMASKRGHDVCVAHDCC